MISVVVKKALLLSRNALQLLDLCLEAVNRVRGLHFDGVVSTSEALHEDLHLNTTHNNRFSESYNNQFSAPYSVIQNQTQTQTRDGSRLHALARPIDAPPEWKKSRSGPGHGFGF